MISSKYRFHGHKSLGFVNRRGDVSRSRQMSLKHISNHRRKTPRVAVVVSKKVSKVAPIRNRIRRRVYEEVRKQLPEMIPGGRDLVFMVYDNSLAEVDSETLKSLIKSLLKDSKSI